MVIMPQIKVDIVLATMAIMLTTCIIPYEPHISVADVNKFVVSGQVNDNRENQQVSVSMASSINEPQYIPLQGCNIMIYDDKGNEFVMEENYPGTYECRIESNYLTPGTSFKIEIFSPDGTHLESDFDKMYQCPEIDTVYFVRKELQSLNPEQITRGLQFYTDLDGRNTDSHFFRWEAIETWEYHVPYAKEWYYDGTVHHIYPPDSSRMVCWTTGLVKNIYTLSTEGLVENKYRMFPLNFVDNHTSRLRYCYSLLLNQYSLSEGAYSYWDQLRINSSEQGGLYEKQPLSITGNLHNLSNPDQKVLGFFSASSVRSKRIFVLNVEDLAFDYLDFCTPAPLGFFGLREIEPDEYPAFLMGNRLGYQNVVLSQYCVDCLSLGGTIVKPDFWPY